MGRKGILSSLFSLLSILLFLRFQDSHSRQTKVCLYLSALVFSAAALLSKMNSAILPGILFLCALFNREEMKQEGFRVQNLAKVMRSSMVQVLPFFVLALILFIWYQSMVADYGLFDKKYHYSLKDLTRLVLIVNPLIFIEYLKMVFIPWNLEAYYSTPSIFTEVSVGDLVQVVSIFSLSLATVVLMWRFNRTSCLLLLCFFVAMLPYGNWVNFGFWYANRYVYFSSIFLIAAFSNVVVALQARSGSRMVKLTAVLLLGWVFTHNVLYRSQYLGVWQNGITLWEHEISLPGASIHDYNNLTSSYIGQAERSPPEDKEIWLLKARTVNEKAFELEIPSHEMPWLSVAHYYKGLILAYSDATLESQLMEFLKAVHSSTGFSSAIKRTAVVYYQLALQQTDPDVRTKLAGESLSFFRKYFESRADNSRTRTERYELFSSLKSVFPELVVPEIETHNGL